jgi:L-alanine-DL-glutamate epimerase-like enolase superfamily enzyme
MAVLTTASATSTVAAVLAVSLPAQRDRAPTILPDWAEPAITPPPPVLWPEQEHRFAVRIIDSGGAAGTYGPCSLAVVDIIRDQLAPALIGRRVDVWRELDAAPALGRHRRGGHYRLAVSAIELALWDLRGVRASVPAAALLGGPVRERVPAYATALGIDIDHPAATDVAGWIAGAGFWGQKWALPGAGLGEPAARDAERLLRLRDAAGHGARIMIDALGRWDQNRLRYLVPALVEAGVEWVEEPTSDLDQVMAHPGVAIAGGEHAYDRVDQLRLITGGRVQVWQPDVAWHGGLTRALAMVDLAAEHAVASFPHAASLPAALHLAALSPAVPAVEYHLTLDPRRHAVLHRPPVPDTGAFLVPAQPGLAGVYVYTDAAEPQHLAGERDAS